MTESGLPMAGLRVLDISSFIAAPAAAVVLGDWGADVIKIEGPDGDANRRIMHDSSNYPKGPVNYPWQMDSRNKRSLVLDLKQPPARAALDRLIATSDVLVCNFPPPVRDKLKLTYDDAKRVNPRLIYASLTGYGETGPDRDRPGFDVTAYFARSGLLDAQRYEGGPPGVPVPAQGDRATAMTLVSAILMALIHRMKTGEGSWVGTSLLGNGLWSCGVIAQAALVGAYLPHRPPPDRPRSAFGTISRPQDVPDDEQAVACGAVVDTAIPEMPRTLANPIRLGFAEQQIAKSAPTLGEHSDQILAEAGLSRDEITSLR